MIAMHPSRSNNHSSREDWRSALYLPVTATAAPACAEDDENVDDDEIAPLPLEEGMYTGTATSLSSSSTASYFLPPRSMALVQDSSSSASAAAASSSSQMQAADAVAATFSNEALASSQFETLVRRQQQEALFARLYHHQQQQQQQQQHTRGQKQPPGQSHFSDVAAPSYLDVNSFLHLETPHRHSHLPSFLQQQGAVLGSHGQGYLPLQGGGRGYFSQYQHSAAMQFLPHRSLGNGAQRYEGSTGLSPPSSQVAHADPASLHHRHHASLEPIPFGRSQVGIFGFAKEAQAKPADRQFRECDSFSATSFGSARDITNDSPKSADSTSQKIGHGSPVVAVRKLPPTHRRESVCSNDVRTTDKNKLWTSSAIAHSSSADGSTDKTKGVSFPSERANLEELTTRCDTPEQAARVLRIVGTTLRSKADPFIDVTLLPFVPSSPSSSSVRRPPSSPGPIPGLLSSSCRSIISRKPPPAKITSFPEVLHDLLEMADRERLDDIVCWLPHRRAFRINNKDRFMKELLPAFFTGQNRWSSFLRQLNLYGFSRVTKGTDYGAYYHELMIGGRPDLCQYMRRVGTPKGLDRRTYKLAEGDDPDFYAMPLVMVRMDVAPAQLAPPPLHSPVRPQKQQPPGGFLHFPYQHPP